MTKAELQALLARIEAANGPDRLIDAAIQHAVFPTQRVMLDAGKAFGPGPKRPAKYGVLSDVDLSDWWDVQTEERKAIAGLFEASLYTSSLDAIIGLISRELVGWMWRVATCGVSDDAWLAPDINDPVHGERLKREFPVPEDADPTEWWLEQTDVDRRPPGQPALALCATFIRAKLAMLEPSDAG